MTLMRLDTGMLQSIYIGAPTRREVPEQFS